MRWLICAVLPIFLFGCEGQSYEDPYVAMMDNYTKELSNWDYKSDEHPTVPERPSFLPCERLPHRTSYRRRRDIGYSSQCDETNQERKTAYKTAVNEYESVAAKIRTKM